jgi:hypothetical protein
LIKKLVHWYPSHYQEFKVWHSGVKILKWLTRFLTRKEDQSVFRNLDIDYCKSGGIVN